MTGPSDFLVHVAVRGAQHLRDLAMSSFTTRPEVLRIETSVLFEQASGQGYRRSPKDRCMLGPQPEGTCSVGRSSGTAVSDIAIHENSDRPGGLDHV